MPENRFRSLWALDPEIQFLNHGSFGACPRAILERQTGLRHELEREPVLLLGRRIEGRLDAVREVLGRFVGADPDDLALVPNATTGVNTVLQSLELRPGDEILCTNHEYNASHNAAVAVAARAGAHVVTASVPFPLQAKDQIVEALAGAITPKTRLLLIDHVTSPTALVFPAVEILSLAESRGVDVLIDGAHAPGMLPLDLEDLGAAYYTGNCHKWLCTPKGSAFLHVRRDLQKRLPPLVISHGYNSKRRDRSRFRLLFDWTGTCDPTPWLCIPDAIDFLRGLFPGGFQELRQHNHEKVIDGRARLLDALEVLSPAPADTIGSLATVPLPGRPRSAIEAPLFLHPLQERLFEEHRVEVPIMSWPDAEHWCVRISAQAYNAADEYEELARGLRRLVTETCA